MRELEGVVLAVDAVEHPLAGDRRGERDVVEADRGVQVAHVVAPAVAALVVLVGVVAAERDAADGLRVERVFVAEDRVDLRVLAGVEAVLLRDVGRVEDAVHLGGEAQPARRGGERVDRLGVVGKAAADLAGAPVGAEGDFGKIGILLELRGRGGGILRERGERGGARRDVAMRVFMFGGLGWFLVEKGKVRIRPSFSVQHSAFSIRP